MVWSTFFFTLFFFLHIVGAILAFGPTFVNPIIGSLVRKNPQNLRFAVTLQQKVTRGMVVPVAMTMPVSGIAMVLVAKIDFFRTPFLLISTVLWAALVGIGIGVQLPVMARLLEITATPPPAGAAGPPPEVLALVNRGKIFGMVQYLLLAVILFLMIFQPGQLH